MSNDHYPNHLFPPLRVGRCYKCSRITMLTTKRKVLCKACHLNATLPKLQGTFPKNNHQTRYSYMLKLQRVKVIKKLKRCQLCGATSDLTVHHIGGSTELGLTCLCRTCHQAYESWQQKRRDGK